MKHIAYMAALFVAIAAITLAAADERVGLLPARAPDAAPSAPSLLESALEVPGPVAPSPASVPAPASSSPPRLPPPGAVSIPASTVAAAIPAGFTVVLDPGHGGSNLGAPGSVPGVFEKKVTLIMARLVKKRLERDGVKVVVTREADSYLTLGERVRRANAAGGHAFVSLHANATPEHKRRGFDAYLLSREVVDIAARRAGERREDQGDPSDAVVARARVRQLALASSQLARSLRERMGRVREGDRGTRQAPFDVLEGLAMPAVLFEMGFIDHPDEGPELIQPEVMHAIADAIAEGIESFAAAGSST